MRRSVSRRFVLTGAAVAATSLVIPIALTRTRATERSTDHEITDWIVIAANGQVTLGLSQPEVGQGSYTALPQILADELDADWKRVEVQFVTGRPAYKIAFRQEAPVQKEGASMSTTVLYERLRTAGAAAREVLIRAAAQTWGIDISLCRTENGFVINSRGEKLSYGQLAADAAKLPLSAAPPLKHPSRFHLIGKPVARLDTPAKCNGSAVYGIDVNVPGMLNAAITTAPSFTGQIIAIKNEGDILKMPGVRAVVKIPAIDYRDGSSQPSDGTTRYNAVCVVADHFWQARRALVSLDVTFDGGAHGDLSSDKINAALDAALSAEHGVTALVRGQPRAILKDHAASVIERRFKLPHIAHAPHEPCNATASYNNGAVEVWGPVQSVSACQDAIAESFSCPADKVAVHVTFLGGSFGRKIVPDFVVQAVHASKAVGRPVKLIRSREEDTQHDVYRPNAGAHLRAVLDPTGYPLAVHARVAGQSLFNATRRNWLDHTPEGDWDESMVDGLYNQSYRLPHFLVETVDTPLPVPVYFMRSVGSTAAVFFWESLITELAHQAKIDQYAYRRHLLSADPLALHVLDAAAKAAGWETPPPPDTFRGIAYNCYIGRGGRFKTYVAQVVELRRVADRLAVKRVVCAVDPGLAVNPNTVKAQIEGGIGFAMTTALKSKITFSNGGTDQSNFFDYNLLSIDEMPEIVPIVLPSDRPPQGMGEVVLAPIAPAIAQALLHGTGRRLDVMPFPDDAFKAVTP
ncbi:MAG TPA: molybdopterin cofactor-binding domain-containing protein [Xanthobacteraceae bacterium]|nr:molybdopterin cofactor-binding domain-containing protein [Xanthobacteraceae bacterium]